MYENGQGHLTLFCILGPSGGIYYPNFVPCFVYHQLNDNVVHPTQFSLVFSKFSQLYITIIKLFSSQLDLNHVIQEATKVNWTTLICA